jgi:acyl-CoA thioesterase FadM
VEVDVLVACVGRDGRPRRVPPALRAALEAAAPTSPSIVQKTP